MGLDKKQLIDQLAARLKESVAAATRSSADAAEAARTMQTESEKKEDGRGALEYGRMAAAESSRSRKVAEELRTLAEFWNAGLRRSRPRAPSSSAQSSTSRSTVSAEPKSARTSSYPSVPAPSSPAPAATASCP